MGLQEYFQQAFQRGIGTPLGHTFSAPKPYIGGIKSNTPDPKQVMEGIRQGVISLPSSIEGPYQNVYGARSVGEQVNGPEDLPLMQRILDRGNKQIDKETAKRLKPLKKEILEAKRIDFAAKMQEQLAAKGEKFHESSNPLARFVENGPKNWLQKGLEYMGRPQQALFGAMMEGVDRNDPEKNSDDKLDWSGLAGGLWHGLTGQSHYTGGQVAEEYFPGAPHPAKIALGVGAELGLDPMNLVGLEGLKVATGSGKVLKDAALAEELANVAGEQVAKSGIDTGTRALSHGGKMMAAQNALTATTKSAASDVIKRILLENKKGALKRTSLGTKNQAASTIATGASEAFRSRRLKTFDNMIEQFRGSVTGTGPTLSPARIKIMKNNDEFFKAFHDALPTGKITPTQWDGVVTKYADDIRAGLDKDVGSLTEHIFNATRDSYKPGLGLRVGKKTVKIPFVGDALEVVTGRAAKHFKLDEIRELSHAGKFPGRLALLQQRGRSIGAKRLGEFQDEIRAFVRQHGFTKDEAKDIIHTIETKGAYSHDPRLQEGMDFVVDHLKRMYDEEVSWGARDKQSTPYLDNYTYPWNRKGPIKRLQDFKKERKKLIKDNGGSSAAGYQIHNARKEGFKPVDNAFDMLVARQVKSNRDITRAMFTNDLVQNYGISARGLGKYGESSRGLVHIEDRMLSDGMRNRISSKAGDKYYLPKSMNDVLRDTKDMSRFDSDPKVMRYFRKLTNVIKSSVTVYNPGYHVRNMMSDTIMGQLDKVGLKPYYDLLKKGSWELRKEAGKKGLRFRPKTGATIRIGNGWTMTTDELWNLFKENAAGGGFFGAEFGANPAQQILHGVRGGVRNVSEKREDFGRVAHFLGALRQEWKGSKKGFRTVDDAQRAAVEAATYRVNQFKFDYGALTKWEQKWVKPVVPFYTFTRKAVPTLAENFAMNPKWLIRYNKLNHLRDEQGADAFQPYLIPQWMKDVGYATLKDEKEPWVGTFEGLPTNVFQGVWPGDKSAQSIMQNLMKQVNPVIQAPIEIGQGKELFSGQKIDDYKQYALHKLGGPLQAGVKAKEDWGNMAPWQIALSSRLGLGLPIRKVDQDTQDFMRKQWEDQNIEAPFDKFNEGPGKKSGISIYTSKGDSDNPKAKSSYKVKDNNTDRVLYQGIDPFKALEVAQSKQSRLPVKLNSEGESVGSLDTWNSTKGASKHIRVYFSERKDGNSYRVRDTKSDKTWDFKSPNAALQFAKQH